MVRGSQAVWECDNLVGLDRSSLACPKRAEGSRGCELCGPYQQRPRHRGVESGAVMPARCRSSGDYASRLARLALEWNASGSRGEGEVGRRRRNSDTRCAKPPASCWGKEGQARQVPMATRVTQPHTRPARPGTLEAAQPRSANRIPGPAGPWVRSNVKLNSTPRMWKVRGHRSANAGIPAPHNNIPRTWCVAMTGMVAREDRKVPGHWNDAPVTLDLGRDHHLTSLRLP